MRICDVNNFYSPHGGGVRNYHDNKFQYFAAREGHAYALVVPSRRHRVDRRGCAARYEVPAVPFPGRPYRVIVSWRALRRVIDDFRPDVVEVGSPYVLPWLVRRALKGTGIPCTGFYHADYPHAYLGAAAAVLHRGLRRPFERLGRLHVRRAYAGSAVVLCASRRAEARLRQAGLRNARCTPLGLDPSTFRPHASRGEVRRALGIPAEARMVLHTSRLHPEKSVRRVLAAYEQFRDPGRLWLVVVTYGPLAELVRTRLGHRGDVRLLDFLQDPDELARLLGEADLGLSLSPHDTFALGALETMACGTRTLALRGSAAAELLERCAGGDLVSDLRPATIATGVRAALSVRSTTASRQALHERVRAAYGWDKTFDRQLEAYAAVIGRGDAHPAEGRHA